MEENFEKAREILNNYIAGHNMRKTPEREAILRLTLQLEGHKSTDEILMLMPSNFHVSRVTMYSTLQLFASIGLLYAHQLNGVALYENAFGVERHHHCICTECNEIHDIYDSSLTNVAMQAKTPRFTKVCSNTYIYGVCAKCKAKIARWKKESQKLEALSAAAAEVNKKDDED